MKMRQISLRLALVLLCALCSVNFSFAKVADRAPIEANGIIIQSHANYVEAIRKSTNKRLWKTTVFRSGYVREFDPQLEKDAQWNIIQALELHGRKIYVRNSKGKEYWLDMRTGKLIPK
jgi:hypothetical protein